MKKIIKIIMRYIICNFKKDMEYRYTFILQFVIGLVALFISLLFWKVLFLNMRQFEGWNLSSVILLHYYSEIFLELFITFLIGAHEFWSPINRGTLDIYLIRPIDPRLAYLAKNFTIIPLINLVIKSFIILPILFLYFKLDINIFKFIFSIITIMLVSCIIGITQITFSSIAFWWGRVDALDKILDMIFEFFRYPLTVLPYWIRSLLTIAIPIIFASTYPALFTLQKMSNMLYLKNILILIIVGIVWLAIHNFIWKKGLKRYESYGG
jgi:ABC-type uncharacterized transport system permease subunit